MKRLVVPSVHLSCPPGTLKPLVFLRPSRTTWVTGESRALAIRAPHPSGMERNTDTTRRYLWGRDWCPTYGERPSEIICSSADRSPESTAHPLVPSSGDPHPLPLLRHSRPGPGPGPTLWGRLFGTLLPTFAGWEGRPEVGECLEDRGVAHSSSVPGGVLGVGSRLS